MHDINQVVYPLLAIADMFGTFGIIFLMIEHNNEQYQRFMSIMKKFNLLNLCICCQCLVDHAINGLSPEDDQMSTVSEKTSNTTTSIDGVNDEKDGTDKPNVSTLSTSYQQNNDIENNDISNRERGITDFTIDIEQRNRDETIETKTVCPVMFDHVTDATDDVDPSAYEYTRTN